MSISLVSASGIYKAPATVFGLRLRQARLRLGASQRILGLRIGLEESTAAIRISRYESGVHEPAYAVAERLARELAIPVAYLYCREDELAALVLGWGTAHKERLPAIA